MSIGRQKQSCISRLRAKAKRHNNSHPAPVCSYEGIVQVTEELQIRDAVAFAFNLKSLPEFLQVFEIVMETFKLKYRCRERKIQLSGRPEAPEKV